MSKKNSATIVAQPNEPKQCLERLSQKSRKLNNAQIHTTQRLKPFPIGDRTGLSIGGRIIWKCGECKHHWVKPIQRESITIWICERCNTPRLVRRQKSDEELISEVLNHSRLTSFERTFTQTHSKKLGTWQRKRIQGFAQRLGISLEYNCSLSDVEGGEG